MYEKQKLEIKNNNMDYFSVNNNMGHISINNLTEKELTASLEYAISTNKIKFVKHFLDCGVKIKNEMSLDVLTKNKKSLKTFKLLENHGFDLKQRGEILMFKSALNLNVDLTKYLVEKTDFKSRAINITHMNVCSVISQTKKNEEKEKLYEILNLLNGKIDEEILESGLEKIKKEDNDVINKIKHDFLLAQISKEESHKKELIKNKIKI